MTVLWRPDPERVRSSLATAFMARLGRRLGLRVRSFAQLYDVSLRHNEAFWREVRDVTAIAGRGWDAPVLADGDRMPGARFFPAAELNFARNLLRRRDDPGDAVVFWGEERWRRRLSWAELYDRTSVLAQALRDAGVGPGDRVAGYLPNLPEAVIAMLASTSLGAIWTSCSPDFGVRGVLDRFGQVRPKVLLAADGYVYGGKVFALEDKLRRVVAGLPSLERVLLVPYAGPPIDAAALPKARLLDDFVAAYDPAPIDFASLPFNHPLYVLYSSGTTGAPKCIVHGAGGTLLEHLKELALHCDVRPGDRVFYFTTCGWMMWNWLVSALAREATLLLYDGNPFHPHPEILFDYAEAEGMTLFGTSAKYLDALRKRGAHPAAGHALPALRLITSTGSPLAPESFDYVYERVKGDVQLASISGGTDIVGCFMLGDPTAPVRRGEIQCRSLGLAVEVYDPAGRPLVGEPGELVCTRPFPSMPLGFWGDEDGSRYRAAYFERFPGVWTHGDWVELRPGGGLVIYGRSDATLNPGGVRIGTAEIYRVVEQLDEVVECLAIGQEWQGDQRIVLFVVLRPGVTLDERLATAIRQRIRKECSPRHVPAKVLQVADLPRTRSGKLSELAVRDVVHGRPVKNREALANPEALELVAGRPELAE
ncbi:MAG: acetoacetate--CoA ligase [Acidobacteria bacterium]|nr:MAG: acetoacetate--CoA ligase [Acidobacteriota bacterium]